MEKTIILSGGTGFLADQFISKLAEGKTPICFVGRGKGDISLKDRIINSRPIEEQEFIRNKCYFLEIELSDRGKILGEVRSLNLNISSVWHLAANLSFNKKKKEQVIKENLESTKSFFNLSKDLGCDFCFVSTAYIHGNRTGTLYENELILPTAFNNGYEESKYLCEKYIHTNFTGNQNIFIIRPGILISETKPDGHFGFYVLMQATVELKKAVENVIGKRQELFIPFPFLYAKNNRIDFVNVEMVVDIMYAIQQKIISNEIKEKNILTIQASNSHPHKSGDILHQLLNGAGIKMPTIGVHKKVAQTYINIMYIIGRLIPPLRSFTNRLNYYSFFITEDFRHDTTNLEKYFPEQAQQANSSTELFKWITEEYSKKKN
jgi:nucleoside-diphosphate-sugar epimerase